MSTESLFDRRAMLSSFGSGLAGIALGTLLGELEAKAAPARGPHFAPKAKRVLEIFCPGGVSHMDTWDYKPALEKHHGQPMPGEEHAVSFQGPNGNLMKSPWGFTRRGKSGKMVTDLFPHLGGLVDEMAFIHSMTSKSNTHGPGCTFMNTGYVAEGFPANGAWVSYGLGSLNDNLPTYVVITDVRGEPPSGAANWTCGFLPAEHQGIPLSIQQPLRNLKIPASIDAATESDTREMLHALNARHAAQHPGNSQLQARMTAYDLAARMQLSAPQVSDLTRESKATHRRYGSDDPNPLKAAYAKNCLLARRLLERDVRYVTLYCASRASGADGLLNWDAHKTLKADYERHCPIFDQPTAALLIDLKSRGLLHDTLVLWTTEFGRRPTCQAGTTGRDHNPDGFTVWLMGAGVRPGVSYGATDEFGRRAVEKVSTVYDLYATVLHTLGLDYKRLSYYHNGLERRLTDVHGNVIQEVLG